MTEAKIKAILPYFGGKRNLAPLLVQEFGPHRVYWSVFCGSIPELLIKPPCVMETVNDLFGDLINLARVIKDGALAPTLYRRLRRVLMAEELFDESGEIIRTEDAPEGDAPDLERAYHYFITAWLGRNGVAGTSNYKSYFCMRYIANGGHAAKRWDSAVRSIPAWRRRLANVTILRRDAFDLLTRIEDKAGTVIYCDPPYITKDAKYVHDFNQEDHGRLAELLKRFKKSRVVVSYYDHPLLVELYPKWTNIKIEVSKALASQGRRGENHTKATEVLLINGQSFSLVESAGLFAEAAQR